MKLLDVRELQQTRPLFSAHVKANVAITDCTSYRKESICPREHCYCVLMRSIDEPDKWVHGLVPRKQKPGQFLYENLKDYRSHQLHLQVRYTPFHHENWVYVEKILPKAPEGAQ